MRNEITTFVLAVGSRYLLLLGGGVVVTVLAIAERYFRQSVHWRSYVAVLLCLFVVACFLAWRDEHREVSRLSTIKAESESMLKARTDERDGIQRIADQRQNQINELTTEAQKKRATTPASSTPPAAPVSIASGGAASFGQQGGVTAATLNVQTNIPPWTYELKPEDVNVLKDGKYQTSWSLVLHAVVLVPKLGIRVDGPFITNVMAIPIPGGMVTSSSGAGDGFFIVIVQQAYGDYRIVATTSQPADLKIRVGPAQ